MWERSSKRLVYHLNVMGSMRQEQACIHLTYGRQARPGLTIHQLLFAFDGRLILLQTPFTVTISGNGSRFRLLMLTMHKQDYRFPNGAIVCVVSSNTGQIHGFS